MANKNKGFSEAERSFENQTRPDNQKLPEAPRGRSKTGLSEHAAESSEPRSSQILKVRQIGNSACVILSKEMLAKLGVEIGEDLRAIETARGIELTAFDADLDDALKWIEKGAKRYRNTLRALSK